MITLPEKFLTRMKTQLGQEFDEFLSCYEKPAFRGLRVNTLKMPIELWGKIPFELSPSKFANDSFYLLSDDEKIGHSPYHHAGAIYSQEPSASAAPNRAKMFWICVPLREVNLPKLPQSLAARECFGQMNM